MRFGTILMIIALVMILLQTLCFHHGVSAMEVMERIFISILPFSPFVVFAFSLLQYDPIADLDSEETKINSDLNFFAINTTSPCRSTSIPLSRST